ncbi:MAG TPA: D-alanyl-D-alanine carboxypeptidase/D-alanyl-D-alanine-endopeptidase [Polyangia bacterium]|nr:D-alanyl-D-alanine carboxypeptidase/D-alanyl-D-alanine-endopeptidase [Polyangia bacterium]
MLQRRLRRYLALPLALLLIEGTALLLASRPAFGRPEAHTPSPHDRHARTTRRGGAAAKHRDGGKRSHKQHRGVASSRDTELARPTPTHSPASPVRPVLTPAPDAEPRLASLQTQIASILGDRPLSRTRVGVQVMTARDGQILFDYNSDRLFNPASNTKILATAAALSELGPDYRYRTTLHGPLPDDDGVIHGDVELRGSGDPSLSTLDMADLAHDLAARGVTRIEGDIVVDGRYHDPGAPDRVSTEQALFLNRNTYAIRVSPTSPNKPATLSIDPATEYIQLRSKVTTVERKKTRLRVDVSREGERLIVTVRGRVHQSSDAVIRHRIGEGSVYAVALLRRMLGDFGVLVTGGVRRAHVAGDVSVLAEHLSQPLADICRISNKDSNNFVADVIFKTLGGARYGGAPSLDKGRRAVDELMEPIGISPGDYRIINGSGLTHENRITPSILTRLLRHLYFDLAVAPEFLASLSVGGVDGTTRNRFRGTDAVGLVRAKTGTLSGVSALSGYVGDGGDVLIFSILVEGVRHSRLQAVRRAQVRMVQAMLRYIRAGGQLKSVPSAPDAPVADPEEQRDFEGDGDDNTEAGGE